MAQRRELSGYEIVGWTSLGVLTGMVAGFGLSEWIGAASPHRLTGRTRRREVCRPAH